MDKCSGNELLQQLVFFLVEAVDAPVVEIIRGVLTSGVLLTCGCMGMIS